MMPHILRIYYQSHTCGFKCGDEVLHDTLKQEWQKNKNLADVNKVLRRDGWKLGSVPCVQHVRGYMWTWEKVES